MNSFRNIGAKKARVDLATVAPGIAEALVATAIGLVAAIPAVMAYNYFSRRIRVLASEMETFSSDFLNIVRRQVLLAMSSMSDDGDDRAGKGRRSTRRSTSRRWSTSCWCC